jgi:hypothetical protein
MAAKLSRRIVLAGAAPLFLVSGCGSIGMLASDTKQIQLAENLEVNVSKEKFISVAMETAQYLKYDLLKRVDSSGTLAFQKQSGMFITVLVGKIDHAYIGVQYPQEGNVGRIEANLIGNFGAADQNTGYAVLNEFKAALRARGIEEKPPAPPSPLQVAPPKPAPKATPKQRQRRPAQN